MSDLAIVSDTTALTETPVGQDGKRHCVDCGGWKLDNTPMSSLFMPVLISPQVFGWICELCLLRRLQRRADIVTGTSSKAFGVPERVHRHLDRLADDASLKKVGR